MSHPPNRTFYVPFTKGKAADVMADLPLGHSVHEATRELFVRLREEVRKPDLPQEEPMSDTSGCDIEAAPLLPVRPWPDRLPRRGRVVRKRDVTGISGNGVIAEFCMMSDGAVAWRWLGGGPMDEPAWQFYDNKTTAPFVKISGHNGNTEIVWIDDEDEQDPQTEVPLDQ